MVRGFEDVLHFWFHELTPADWFSSKSLLDEKIKSQFFDTLTAASACELSHWRSSPKGRLAEIIVLDQFSRNIFRNTPGAFANDKTALVLSQEFVQLKLDKDLTASEKAFAYMPYMHSESLKIHEEAVMLFKQPGLEDNYKFEMLHKDIIEKFGRYPHRNKILGRESTEAEIEFLKSHKGF